MFGFLRETQALADANKSSMPGCVCLTGLDTYLGVIFPATSDWIHDKSIPDVTRRRPDYRSESLKLIVEFDGLPHYQNPDITVLQ